MSGLLLDYRSQAGAWTWRSITPWVSAPCALGALPWAFSAHSFSAQILFILWEELHQPPGKAPLSLLVLLFTGDSCLSLSESPGMAAWQLHRLGGICCMWRDSLSGREDEAHIWHTCKEPDDVMVSLHEMLMHFCLYKVGPLSHLVFLVAWSFAWEYHPGCLGKLYVLSHCLQTLNLFQHNRLWYLALGHSNISEWMLW